VKPLKWLAGIGCCVMLAGCGGGVKAADLFIVYRSGAVAGANLTMLVNEEGGVRCNGGVERSVSDPQLIDARAIQEELQQPASEKLSLTPRPGSVLRYYLRDENGSVRFSDNSTGQPTVFRHLALFVLEVSQQVCHLQS
jgi:hypothetical protein